MSVTLRMHREEGAVAVTVAIVLVLLFLITALMVDLGFTRSDARANQTHADFAALAGASAGRDATGSEQCINAVEYFAANAPEVTEDPVTTPCLALLDPCDPTDPVTVGPIVAGPYELYITHPVSNLDDAMTQGDQVADGVRDGDPCDRLKTEVRRNRAYIFAPASGLFAGQSFGNAVALRTHGTDQSQLASLIIIEPFDCEALVNRGGANIDVVSVGTPGTPGYLPGLITLDTEAHGPGTDCNTTGKTAIVAPNSSGSFLRAADHIFSFGIQRRGAGHSPFIYNTSAVGPSSCGVDNPCLSPVPEPGRRVTREPMDHLFNCLDNYPAPGNPYLPNPNQIVGPCPDEPGLPPYIHHLRQSLQGPGPLSGFVATPDGNCPNNATIWYAEGYLGWDVDPRSVDEEDREDHEDLTPHADGKVHIRCSMQSNTSVRILDATYVVFDHMWDRGDALQIHGREDEGAVAYFRHRKGGIDTSGGEFDFNEVFVYVDARDTSGSQRAGVKFGGGATVTWSAPISDEIRETCEDYTAPGLPPAGCFAPLALWSNSNATDAHRIGGSGCSVDCSIEGSLFTPNSTYVINGGGGLDLERAQFYSLRIRVTGGGTIVMKPSPDAGVRIPLFEIGLIR